MPVFSTGAITAIGRVRQAFSICAMPRRTRCRREETVVHPIRTVATRRSWIISRSFGPIALAFVSSLFSIGTVSGATLRVGASEIYTTVQAALSAANDDDTIEVF